MKVSIEKELHKKAHEDKANGVDPMNEVKLLLAGDSTEDARILRGLSSNSTFNKIEYHRGKQIELEKLTEGYQGSVFTVDQIKKLAIDYHLRFLPSKHYTGSYDVEVAAKVKQFAKDTNSVVDNYSLGYRYYILAPEQMFELNDVKHISKRELRRQLDPAIFFQIDENHYRLIHKWGSDFTIFRYLLGYRWKGFYQHWLFNTAMVLPVIAAIAAFVFNLSFICDHLVYFTGITLAASFLFSHLRWGWGKLDNGNIIHSFFGPENWNKLDKIRR